MKTASRAIWARNTLAVVALIAATGLAPACDWVSDDTAVASGDWEVQGVGIRADSLNYAEVYGTITMSDTYSLSPTASVRYYSDEYETLIIEDSETVGRDLENEGETQEFSITHYKVYVEPAVGGYSRVCAKLQVEDSNWDVDGGREVGCIP